ncbi:alpha/beta hydrolase [Pseudokineococcus sp. 5B2Z-1]|uniref:alpha/beta hydrolase n=1 Tax=Pseudokineococcus sp. 5B2Z-1 TaxID=3132744 RepID=UPI0030949550
MRGAARAGRAAAAPLLLAGVLAACSATPQPEGGPATTLPAPGPVTATAGEPAADPALARYYEQQPAWVPCGEVRECTTVEVPVDWDEPAGEALELAVSRVPAGDPGERIGSLLVNPGGPGASGVDWVGADAAAVASEAVRERYDVVGFDPRGVGRSDPVDCLDDAQLDAYLAQDVSTATPADEEAALERARTFAAGCEADAGPLLGEIGTPSVARDLDVLRAVLGDERLTYLGKSYGTLIGAEYARAFPERVGRLVLDGALDPASTADDVALGQARGLEQSLRAFATACVGGDVDDCPLGGGQDGEEGVQAALDEVADLLARAGDEPLPTGDPQRPLTQPLAATGVVAALYDEGYWPTLAGALRLALDGDGSGLLALADAYSGRLPDGSYSSNLLEAFTAVTCLDYPAPLADQQSQDRLREQLEEAAPTLSGLLVGEDVTCDVWPVPPVRTPSPVDAPGAAPVLVVGTTGDPATPYAWAESLADQLDAGRLLTYDGEGHTAYLRSSECVDGAVDGYLLDGVLPGEGATCAG